MTAIRGFPNLLNFYWCFIGEVDILQHAIGKFVVAPGSDNPETVGIHPAERI